MLLDAGGVGAGSGVLALLLLFADREIEAATWASPRKPDRYSLPLALTRWRRTANSTFLSRPLLPLMAAPRRAGCRQVGAAQSPVETENAQRIARVSTTAAGEGIAVAITSGA